MICAHTLSHRLQLLMGWRLELSCGHDDNNKCASVAKKNGGSYQFNAPLMRGWYMLCVNANSNSLGHGLILSGSNGDRHQLLLNSQNPLRRVIYISDATHWLTVSVGDSSVDTTGTRITLSRLTTFFALQRMKTKLRNHSHHPTPELVTLGYEQQLTNQVNTSDSLFQRYCALLEHHVSPYDYTRWLAATKDIGQILPEKNHTLMAKIKVAILTAADESGANPTHPAITNQIHQTRHTVPIIWQQLPSDTQSLENIDADFVLFIGTKTILTDRCFEYLHKAIRSTSAVQLIYSDHDYSSASGTAHSPVFKPQWNPALLRSGNYIGPVFLLHRDLFTVFNCIRTPQAPEAAYQILLEVSRYVDRRKVVRIASPLYRIPLTPDEQPHPAGFFSTPGDADSLQQHFRETNISARVSRDLNTGGLYTRYELAQSPPTVEIIIPIRDQVALLRNCIESILRKASYTNFSICIIDNNSQEIATAHYLNELSNDARLSVRVVHYPGPFNYSAINNQAVSSSHADIIVLLNNDIEVITPTWLSELVTHASQPSVGCVGALLLYPNNLVQHAGVMIGPRGVAGHAHRFFNAENGGYLQRLKLTQNVSAVTAACLAIRRSVFNEVGGFDEAALQVAFNDVDLCLKVQQAGYYNVYTPQAKLYHFESISRGSDKSLEKAARFSREIATMQQRWQTTLQDDSAWNPKFELDALGWQIAPWCHEIIPSH